MEVCPGPWAKAEHLLLVFPMPFSLVACEAKIGSLSNPGAARPWGLRHSSSLEKKGAGPATGLRERPKGARHTSAWLAFPRGPASSQAGPGSLLRAQSGKAGCVPSWPPRQHLDLHREVSAWSPHAALAAGLNLALMILRGWKMPQEKPLQESHLNSESLWIRGEPQPPLWRAFLASILPIHTHSAWPRADSQTAHRNLCERAPSWPCNTLPKVLPQGQEETFPQVQGRK